MCGIAGIYAYDELAPPVVVRELICAGDQMAARGPDGGGLWLSSDSRVGLAHRRLAVIDLSASGIQPMQSSDGRYQIVFNGEIFNYRELRDELTRRGAVFQSQSDTEVLLQLFARDQHRMLNRLRGMFAFAIWDSRSSELFLARDPFGIKPLYFSDDGRTLRFASQVKALIAGGALPTDRDADAELDYWIWGHVREPRTIFKHVRCFEPGTWLKVDRSGRRRSGCFESLTRVLGLGLHDAVGALEKDSNLTQVDEPSGKRIANEIDQTRSAEGSLREALLDSIRHHLVADVPVGVFLSAGIDSTTLAALAVECGGALRTLTLGFEEYRGTADDETPLAEEVARQCGTRHETIWIRRVDFEGLMTQFIRDMDQPSIDGLNTWLVSRAAAQVGLKVVISGLGGDELFGGYPSFRQVPLMHRAMAPFRHLPGLARGIRRVTAPLLARYSNEKYAGLAEYGGSLAGAYLLRRAVRMPWQLPDAQRFELPMVPEMGSDFANVSYLECSLYMRNQLLRDSDWASMAHSVELRLPLVDVPLARYIATGWSTGRPWSKRDLAAAAKPPLPNKVVNRPKTGFTVPVREWLQASSDAQSVERGLRGWQATVLKEFFEKGININAHI